MNLSTCSCSKAPGTLQSLVHRPDVDRLKLVDQRIVSANVHAGIKSGDLDASVMLAVGDRSGQLGVARVDFSRTALREWPCCVRAHCGVYCRCARSTHANILVASVVLYIWCAQSRAVCVRVFL